MTVKLAVLGSTKGTDMQAIIDAIEKRELDAKIVAVISSVPGAFIVERAKKQTWKPSSSITRIIHPGKSSTRRSSRS